ncbi:hypothetical protein [Tessaracoccus sp. OH4464_COT-324]|uniref:hypothetical protein n=1 Tax=Tessaracoccus sp. OH4464_COT-324 TaxID=2491059 RepID=UPI000F633EF3|nr:hypothetical protein [Tessaracoccus sp. OH4464_COT-324]RRD46428.1 hypothetical protein EII42_07265 [Tessaracoccus sp. OH4464_COT-324]
MELILKGVTITVLALVAVSGNGVVRAVLRRADPPRPKADPTLIQVQDKLPGGRWIGVLERLAVYASLMTGFPGGIAVVLGLKGLGRYPELRSGNDPRLGELFIIGTFVSFLWAAACAGAAHGVNRLW